MKPSCLKRVYHADNGYFLHKFILVTSNTCSRNKPSCYWTLSKCIKIVPKKNDFLKFYVNIMGKNRSKHNFDKLYHVHKSWVHAIYRPAKLQVSWPLQEWSNPIRFPAGSICQHSFHFSLRYAPWQNFRFWKVPAGRFWTMEIEASLYRRIGFWTYSNVMSCSFSFRKGKACFRQTEWCQDCLNNFKMYYNFRMLENPGNSKQ
jgi:hypothetical protein